jgi:hypothetical protein
MGKQFCVSVFVSLLVLVSSFHKAGAQCTPGFLGEDKAFIMCSETVTIDYSFLFQVAATYVPVALSPFDTLKGTGNQADTIIAYKAKIQVIAVLENGCKDTAIVRVPLNRDPYPALYSTPAGRLPMLPGRWQEGICLQLEPETGVLIQHLFKLMSFPSLIWERIK